MYMCVRGIDFGRFVSISFRILKLPIDFTSVSTILLNMIHDETFGIIILYPHEFVSRESLPVPSDSGRSHIRYAHRDQIERTSSLKVFGNK